MDYLLLVLGVALLAVGGEALIRGSQAYVDEVRSLIREAVEDLRNSGIPYADIDVPSVSNAYYVLL